ncbi:MAG: sulfur carrier protein ThiS [Fuerstiella sp.]
MISIEVNGERRTVEANCSVRDLLQELGINNRYCAVERNLQLVPRELHADCRLKPGDRIEVVTLVGGG